MLLLTFILQNSAIQRNCLTSEIQVHAIVGSQIFVFPPVHSQMDLIDLDEDTIDAEILNAMAVTQDHFRHAQGQSNPAKGDLFYLAVALVALLNICLQNVEMRSFSPTMPVPCPQILPFSIYFLVPIRLGFFAPLN